MYDTLRINLRVSIIVMHVGIVKDFFSHTMRKWHASSIYVPANAGKFILPGTSIPDFVNPAASSTRNTAGFLSRTIVPPGPVVCRSPIFVNWRGCLTGPYAVEIRRPV